MDILYAATAFIVTLGILVTVHEFGHFWVARRLGIKVLRFSVGFGRALWSRRLGQDQTEYVVAMVPLGGYVKMLDESEGNVAPHEAHRAFNRQTLATRIAVVAAGPAFNFLFAILAYWFMFMAGVEGLRPVIAEVAPASAAEEAGFRANDEIEAVRGKDVATWQSAVASLVTASLDRGRVGIDVVDASGVRRERIIDFEGIGVDDLTRGRFFERLGLVPAGPTLPAVIGGVEAGQPAERDGVRPGDRVVLAAGVPVESWSHLVRIVRARPGETFAVVVERGTDRVDLVLTPDIRQTADGDRIGRIGAAVAEPDGHIERFYVTERYGPLSAFAKGVERTVEISALTLRMIWKMVLLEVSVENLSGPIGIAEYAGNSARFGLARFVEFLAIVSVSLGILNLLPVPLLDGGHLFYYAVEFVRGRPVSDETMYVGRHIGIAFLVGLMGLAVYNDLVRLLG